MKDPIGPPNPGQHDGVIEVLFNPEDQGVFAFGAERVWRFIANRYIDEAINNTVGPINIASVGGGFWQAEMLRLEYLKRCDGVAGNEVVRDLTARIETLGEGKLQRIFEGEPIELGWLDAAKQTIRHHRPLIRAVITDTLYNPPTRQNKTAPSNEIVQHYKAALENTDSCYIRDYELDTQPGEGRWEILKPEPLGTTLLHELIYAFGGEERARHFIRHLAGQLTNLTSARLRPFKVTSLDWRDPSDLKAIAQLALDHPGIFETDLFRRAESLQDHHQQAHPFDLSMVPDKSVTCMLVNHWPRYDDIFHDTGDALMSPLNFIVELPRVMQPRGTVVFFPWQLPENMVQGRSSRILGVAEEMLMHQGFEVRFKSDTTEAIIKAAASYGRIAMAFAPQLQTDGQVITFAATKRSQTLEERLDSRP